ncbi:YusW family protein [Jeotgalibacillus soli]|uniref:YusW-like protein n=1 Tax=Jeotgalibacillus soli TaxID=889306 RepID=A0A0C2RPW0_9BACL|nr:YusW family protein [Jeotgalibacillus soli]KIL43799.1 hypothetical protein KP78_36230 [Jeotgalibacillus soli]
MNKWLAALIAASIVLTAACGNDDTVTETESAPDTANQDSEAVGTPTNSASDNTAVSYLEFDLDVDYEGDNNDVDVSYESEENIEASYEDEREGINLTGNDAYSELEPILTGFDFTADTPDDEVVQVVMDAFSLEENYQSFELEVKYPDGTEKVYTR